MAEQVSVSQVVKGRHVEARTQHWLLVLLIFPCTAAAMVINHMVTIRFILVATAS